MKDCLTKELIECISLEADLMVIPLWHFLESITFDVRIVLLFFYLVLKYT